jgi:hypothetical protein
MTIEIVVTEQDIKTGRPGAASCCAIALAAKRAGLGPVVLVNGFSLRTYEHLEYLDSVDGAQHMRYLLPKEAREFADAYDAGLPVVPFRFYLRLH